MKKCPYCAEMVQEAAVKCRFCGSSLAAPPQIERVAAAVLPRPVPPPAAPKRRSIWVVLAILAGGLGLATYAADRSGAVGVLLVLISLAAAACMVVGKLAGNAPPIVRALSVWMLRRRWWSIATLAILFVGGGAGLRKRGERDDTCTKKLAEARATDSSDSNKAGALESAAEVCKGADRSDDQQRATDDAQKIRTAIAERESAERASAQRAALAQAKQQAQQGAAALAAASYRKAAALGPLDADSNKLYAIQLRDVGKRALDSNNFEDAIASLEQAQRLDGGLADVAEPLARARQLKEKADRVAIVDDALATAKSKCESADDLTAAWARLRTITKGDELYARATTAAAALERCRRAGYQVLLKGLRDVMKAQRQTFADNYERQLLGQGMDVHVRLGGTLGDRLTIQYVLFNRAWAFKITDGGSLSEESFLGQLQKIGFKRVTFSDGYDESYSYDLDPMTEEQALADGPLAKPFKL